MTSISFADRGYIILNTDLPALPKHIKIGQYELNKKDEFHITLVGAKALTHLSAGIDANEAMRDAVKEFADVHDLTHFEILNEFRLVKREERVTVIVMIRLEAINELYEFLNKKFAVNLPTQPPHITLYSLNPHVGISINSIEQLVNDAQVIELSEVYKLLNNG